MTELMLCNLWKCLLIEMIILWAHLVKCHGININLMISSYAIQGICSIIHDSIPLLSLECLRPCSVQNALDRVSSRMIRLRSFSALAV